MSRTRRLVRRTLSGSLAVAVACLVALVAITHAAPFLGYSVFIVRGGSMTPTIPLGSLVAARSIPADKITATDVVTFRLPSGAAVTHRVIEVVDQPNGLYLQTKGDSNTTPDADLIPESAVVGVVDAYAPVAGYVLAMLSIPSGLISVISMLIALVLGIWIIDDQEAERRAALGQLAPELVLARSGEASA